MSVQTKKTFRLAKKMPVSTNTSEDKGRNFAEIDSSTIVQYGVGFDVHKFKIHLCLSAQITTGDIIEVKQHVFNASPHGINEIVNFLCKYYPIKCMLMECTGVYHIALFQALTAAYEDTSTEIIAMNPLLLNRRLMDLGRHADKADAQGLAALSFYRKLLRASYVGTMGFIFLRESMRSFHKTQSSISQCRNRIHKLLSIVNFKAPIDIKSEWGLKLLDRWISSKKTFKTAYYDRIKELDDAGKGIKLLTKREHEFIPYFEVKLNGDMRFALQLQLGRLLYVDCLAATYLRRTEQLVLEDSEFRQNYKALLSIPGFGAVTALTVLVELGDYHRFQNWKAMAKFCGVVPTIHQTGEFKARGHINRYSNKFLRKVLSQAGGVLVNRATKDSDLTRFAYNQFRLKHLPYKKAIIKTAQKLARIVYSILNTKIEYDPNFETALRAKKIRERQFARSGSLMASSRTRGLRRNIQDFIVTNYDFLNSTSKYHLVAGFERMVHKAQWVDRLELPKTTPNGEEKKENYL
ncbi:IS110 family transposase [Candidatus Pacearchaeota archaeon]|nr:IS110 family transposase [Candidatus Pacearchaeota archaeon]